MPAHSYPTVHGHPYSYDTSCEMRPVVVHPGYRINHAESVEGDMLVSQRLAALRYGTDADFDSSGRLFYEDFFAANHVEAAHVNSFRIEVPEAGNNQTYSGMGIDPHQQYATPSVFGQVGYPFPSTPVAAGRVPHDLESVALTDMAATEINHQNSSIFPVALKKSVQVIDNMACLHEVAQAANFHLQVMASERNVQYISPYAAPGHSASVIPSLATTQHDPEPRWSVTEDASAKDGQAGGGRTWYAREAKATKGKEANRAQRVNGKIIVPRSRYVCLIGDCQKKFTHSRSRDRHMNSHFGPLFKCPVCQTTFCRSDTLYRHRKDQDKAEGNDTFGRHDHSNYDWTSTCLAPSGDWFYELRFIEQVREPPANDPILKDLNKWRQLYGFSVFP